MRLIDADVITDWMIKELRNHFCGAFNGLSGRQAANLIGIEIDNAPIVGEWVSVKDRMPDAAGYECLVCAVNTNYNQTHVFTAHTGYGEPGWWTGNVNYMSKATSPCDNRLHPALKVTHWMPLPEPPKEDETNAPD